MKKPAFGTNSASDLTAVQSLHEKHGVEQHQRLEERKAEMKASIETQLHEEYDRRLAIQKERLRLDYNQALQQRLREVEANLEQEMERRFVEMEGLEISRLEEAMRLCWPNGRNNYAAASEPDLNNNFVSDSSSVKPDSKWNMSVAAFALKRTSPSNFNRTSNSNSAVKPTTSRSACVKMSNWPSPSVATSSVAKSSRNLTNNNPSGWRNKGTPQSEVRPDL